MVRSKKEIAQWASAAAQAQPDGDAAYDEDDELHPHRSAAEEVGDSGASPFLASRSDDWANELDALSQLLRSTKVSLRTRALLQFVPHDIRSVQSSKQRAQLALLLCDAGMRYDDTHSVKLALNAASPLVDSLIRTSGSSAAADADPVASQAVKALVHQVGHAKGSAPRARANQVTWLATLLQLLLGAGPVHLPGLPVVTALSTFAPQADAEASAAKSCVPLAKEVVILLAKALNALWADHAAKPSVKTNVLTPVRRALRAVSKACLPLHLPFVQTLPAHPLPVCAERGSSESAPLPSTLVFSLCAA